MDTSGRFGVLSAVVGDAGVGKSTLAGILSSTIGRSARVARTTAAGPQVGHLLQEILDQLEPGVTHREKTAKSILALRQCTNRHWAERVPTVVIVDDAHELSPEAVESLVQVGCAHLILVGRPHLVDKLASAANVMIAGKSRSFRVCHMMPLYRQEALDYLADRLAAAGGRLGLLFTPSAAAHLVGATRGLTTRLEEAAQECLEQALEAGLGEVNLELVERVLGRSVEDVVEPTPSMEIVPDVPAMAAGAEWHEPVSYELRTPAVETVARPPKPKKVRIQSRSPESRPAVVGRAAKPKPPRKAMKKMKRKKTKRKSSDEKPVNTGRIAWIAGLAAFLALLSVGFSGGDPLAVLPALAELRPQADKTEAFTPVPAAVDAAVSEDAASEAAASAADVAPEAVEVEPPAPAVITKGYVVQVGVFRSRQNADATLTKLLQTDPQGQVHLGRGFYHVVTQLFETEAEAAAFGRDLKARGFSTYVRSWESVS